MKNVKLVSQTEVAKVLRKMHTRQLQMFQKVESGGGPITKVVLEC